MTAVLWWAVQDENQNEQRQGITMTVVSCLFALRNQVRFVRTWSSPYMARLGVVTAYVRTGSLYTSDKV